MPNEKIAAGQQKEQMEQQKEQMGQQWQADLIVEDEKNDRYGRKKELSRGYNEQEWKDRLFEINGVRNILRHKSIVPQESTNSFLFLQNEMSLNPGLTLQLEEREGQVVEFEERAEQAVRQEQAIQQEQAVQPNQAAQENRRSGLIFSGLGGKLRFQSASMPRIDEQELAVTTIEIPAAEPGQAAKAKISASLQDAVTIEPSPGMKLELKNGQLTNAGNTENAVLHFDTAVWLDGKQLADHIRLKYDDGGLQAEEGEKALLDISKLDYAREKQEAMRRDAVLADSELQMKLVLDEDKGIHIGMDVMNKVASMKLGEINFQLKNPEGLPGHFHNAEEADAVFLGSTLHMQNLSIDENALESELASTTYLGAEVTMKNSLFDAKGILKAKELIMMYQGEELTLKDSWFNQEGVLKGENAETMCHGTKLTIQKPFFDEDQELQGEEAEMEYQGKKMTIDTPCISENDLYGEEATTTYRGEEVSIESFGFFEDEYPVRGDGIGTRYRNEELTLKGDVFFSDELFVQDPETIRYLDMDMDMEHIWIKDKLEAQYLKTTYLGKELNLVYSWLSDKLEGNEGNWIFHDFSLSFPNVQENIVLEQEGLEVKEATLQDQLPGGSLQNAAVAEEKMTAQTAEITVGQEKLDLKNAELREEHILWAETGSGKLNGQDIKLFHMQLGKEQLLEAEAAEMTVEGFSTQLQNYSYQAGQTNAYESAKVMTKIYAGLDKERKDAAQQKDEPEDLFAFTLAAGQIQDASFEEGIQGEETLSHSNFTEKTLNKKESKEGILMKRKIFTRDGFAELQVEKMQFQKEKEDVAKIVGTGTFQLREIPYTLTTRKGKELNGIAYSPDHPLEGIDFTIDSQGFLSADFADEEAEMNLKRAFIKKFENAGESGVKKIKLSGLGIENSFLKVSSVRMDRGFGINQELGEKEEEDANAQKTLKDIFGECSFSATIANITENVQMTPKGIEVQQDDKYKLGTVGVEGLFGFLSGEIDYPEGTVSVSAEKDVETPETPSFLNIPKLNGNLGAGVSIPIPGAPFSVELGVNPSASLGGKVSVEISRGKSFGDPWNEEKEELGIKGGLEAEVKAGIEAYIGIAAGAGQIASISLQLNGNLGAELKGALELQSKLEKERGKKIKQAEDFQFSGGIEGMLKAGLSLSSDAKLLFWKTKIFEIKLIEKELGKLSLKGSGFKSKDSEGLTEGWNFEKLQFTAEFLKHKTQLELKHGLEGSMSLKAMKVRKLERILEGTEEEAKIAWETLEQLKDKEENMIYVLSLEEKEALEKQIKALKEEVTVKIRKCLDLLRESEKDQVKKESKEEITLKEAEKKLEEEKKRNEEAASMMQAAETGGFQKNNFVGLKGIFANGVYESEVARLGIAMLIGEYENGETRFRSSAHKDMLLEGENQLEVDLKTFMESKVLDQGLTAEGYDSAASPLLSMADAMYMTSPDHARYQDLLQSYPNLTFRELLGYAMKGEYVDPDSGETKKLPQSGEELRELLKACLKATVKYHRISEGASDKSKQEKSYKEQYDLTKQIIEERFKRVFTTSYKDMTTKAVFKNPDDIWGELVKIEQNIETAKTQKQKTQQALQETRNRIAEIRIKQKEYEHNLASLQSNALDALQDKKFDSNKAATAVHILTEDYDKKMKDGKEILQSLSEADPHKKLLTGVMRGKNMTESMKEPLNV